MQKLDAHPWKEGMPVFCDRWHDQQVIAVLTPSKIILRNGKAYHRHTGMEVGDWIPWDRATIHPDTPEAEQARADSAERHRLSVILHNATFKQEVTLDQLREALAVLRRTTEIVSLDVCQEKKPMTDAEAFGLLIASEIERGK